MKKFATALALISFIGLPALSRADGRSGTEVPSAHHHRAHAAAAPTEPVPAPPAKPIFPGKKIQLVSFEPDQKAGKIVGSIQEGVSTMYDVLHLLSGPNTIGLKYPEEREMWGYLWLWSYKLENPIEDSIILMDHTGKRVLKGKDPVELYITFNDHDVVDGIEMDLIKKKGGQLVLFP